MVLRQAKSVTELHHETRDHDLVVVPDAPLFLALNRRVDTARLGHHAVTPKIWAQQRLDWPDRRELFLSIVAEAEMDWRRAAYLLDKALSCWEETGDRTAILDYNRYDSAEMRTVVEVLGREESSYLLRERKPIPDDLDVAVVAPHHLTALDRKVLPETWTEVDLFHEATTELPPLHVLSARHEIVRVLDEHVTADNAERVGMVFDMSSPYRPLVESLLDARGVPYHREEEVREDPNLRAFLRLLRLAGTRDRVRVRDVRPILQHLWKPLWRRHDEKLLRHVDADASREVQRFWDHVDGGTFQEALDAFQSWTDNDLPQVRRILTALDMVDEKVTRERLRDLDTFLRTFPETTGQTRDGVLLATPSASTVDRDLVFYLGVDDGWTRNVPRDPWVDRTRQYAVHREQFARLIQNGAQQGFLVQDTLGREAVSPCLHLHEVLDVEFERFTDLPHKLCGAPPAAPGDGWTREALGLEPDPVVSVSASSLNKHLVSPRDWWMSRLVDGEAKHVFTRGKLLHELAAVMATHPDALGEEDEDDVVAWCLEELASFTRSERRDLLETDLRIAYRNLLQHFQDDPPMDHEPRGYASAESTNRLAERLGLSLEAGLAEVSFENGELGVHGRVDLLHDEDHVVDFKSGANPPSVSKVMRAARRDWDTKRPDLQPALYLAHHRHHQPGRALRFTLVHPRANLDDHVRGEADVADLRTTIPYRDQPFPQYAASREVFDALCDVAESNNRRKTLEGMGYDAYRSLFQNGNVPTFQDKAEVQATEFAERFESEGKRLVGDYKYVTRGVASTLKKLVTLRGRAFHPEDLDDVEALVREEVERMNDHHASRFPPGDADRDLVDHPDLILRRL